MRWLATLSTSRAVAIALLWPTTLIILPIVLLRVWSFWMARRNDTLIHAEFVLAPGARVGVLLMLFVPPLIFLGAWLSARR